MMKKNYNVTGPARKEMAQVVGQAVGITPVYMKMPTCAYKVEGILINRSGELLWDESTDEATILKVMEALASAGFTAEAETENAAIEEAQQEAVVETEEQQEVAEEAAQEATESEEAAEQEPVELTVSVPATRHTGNSLRNLVNLVYTRASLINKALGTSFAAEQGLVDALDENEGLRTAEDFRKAVATYEVEHGPALSGITITPEEISFSSLPETTDSDRLKAFTELVAMMNKQALNQKRIQAKAVNEENEKYALRIWLTRLGMNGAEFKTTRKILMENLTGNSAFRTEEEKQRWTKRQAEKREAAKAVEEVAEA